MSESIVLTPPSVTGLRRFTLIEADGTRRLLWGEDGYGIYVADGVADLFGAEHQIVEDYGPFIDGARVRRINVLPGEITLPLVIIAQNGAALQEYRRDLVKWTWPPRGDLTLECQSVDGAVRQVVCRLADRLRLDESSGASGRTFQYALVRLRTTNVDSDPYWHGTVDASTTFQLGASDVPFFPWAPYFKLVTSTVLEAKNVVNAGDIDAFPVWTIRGPGSDPVLTNVSSGAVLALSRTLTDDDTLTIDTRPTKGTIKDQSGNRITAARLPGSSYWTLQAGTNLVRVTMANATNDSLVTLAYRERFLGP